MVAERAAARALRLRRAVRALGEVRLQLDVIAIDFRESQTLFSHFRTLSPKTQTTLDATVVVDVAACGGAHPNSRIFASKSNYIRRISTSNDMCIDAPCAIEFSPRFLCRYPMHSRHKAAFSAENRRLKKGVDPTSK